MLSLLLFFSTWAYGYTLEQNYTYNNPVIHAKDLFAELPVDFEILRIPDDTTRYRIDAQIITKSFELYGIAIDSTKVRYVNFTKESHIDLSPLELQLTKALKERYPTIVITQLRITPRGYLQSLPKEVKAVFDPKLFQNAQGTFYILDEQGIRHYLDYAVTATINVLHTTKKVDRRESLDGLNTQLKTIPFTSFKDIPVVEPSPHAYRFRSSIKANVPLTQRNIEALPLVIKGQKVTVEIRSDNVIVEFEATATQEAGLYDMITIQKSDGKRVKAKVIGENRVELL